MLFRSILWNVTRVSW